MDLNYSPGDVRRLEREGQAQRRSTGQTPEANTLPQILRASAALSIKCAVNS